MQLRLVRPSALAAALLALAGPAVIGSAAPAADRPADARVKSATAAGSGCLAQASVQATLSSDLTQLGLELPALTAATGKSRLARANCDVIVELEHSPGFQLAPEAAELEVDGTVASGADAHVAYRYHYQGGQETPSADEAVTGTAKKQRVTLRPAPVFSPCGATTTLIQGLALRVLDKGAKAPSSVSVDYAGPVRLVWRACTK
jgi:hypothetical protein